MAQKIKVEDRLEELNLSHTQHQLDSPGNDPTACPENDDRLEEVMDFFVSVAECLLDLCSSSNTSKI